MKALKTKILTVRSWAERNERYLVPAFFIGGLIFDNLTLTRIDRVFDNVILLGYLFIATASIILINLFQVRNIENKWKSFLLLLTQFAFGGLFSGYVIFYTKSASLASSWIFLLVIYALFIGNERFRKYYNNFNFQIKVLFVAIFSYLIFFVPVVLKKIGSGIFLLSGVISLIVIYALMFLFFKYISHLGLKREKKLTRDIFLIFLAFNLMYFTNVIPPVPLSLKQLEVYHYVEKTTDGNYLVREEKFNFLKDAYRDWKNEFNKMNNNSPVYVYASVFAPTDLNTEITHIWQRYDEKTEKWITLNEVTYAIKGGRDRGYRGYTLMENAIDGKWRVYVKNSKGQVLGKIKFEVKKVDSVELVTKTI
ncbi:MAG: DUF2914 domain-containing protein [Candidatus Pacebacteria bacterium]|nr:DUF2914 domain-containing protein [Candidatus Paceibacterota bacterium]